MAEMRDARGEYGARKRISRDRELLDGTPVEFLRSFMLNTEGRNGSYVRMAAEVVVKGSGEHLQIWYNEMRRVPGTGKTMTAIEAINSVHAPKGITKGDSSRRADGLLDFNTVVGLGNANTQVLGRIIQMWPSPMGKHEIDVPDPVTGTTRRSEVQYYRVRMADGRIDHMPETELIVLGGPELTWRWRRDNKILPVHDLEGRIRDKALIYSKELEALGVLFRDDDSKRPLSHTDEDSNLSSPTED